MKALVRRLRDREKFPLSREAEHHPAVRKLFSTEPTRRQTQRAARRWVVWNAAECSCVLCGKPVPYHGMTIEHVFPQVRHGDVSWHTAPAHRSCNEEKGDKPPTREQIYRLMVCHARMGRRFRMDSFYKEQELTGVRL